MFYIKESIPLDVKKPARLEIRQVGSRLVFTHWGSNDQLVAEFEANGLDVETIRNLTLLRGPE